MRRQELGGKVGCQSTTVQQWRNINLNPERHLSCPVSRQPPLILRSLAPFQSLLYILPSHSFLIRPLCCLFSLSPVFRSTTTTVTAPYFISHFLLASRLLCTPRVYRGTVETVFFSLQFPLFDTRFSPRFVFLVKSSSSLSAIIRFTPRPNWTGGLSSSLLRFAFYYFFPRFIFNCVSPIVLTLPFSRTMFSRSFCLSSIHYPPLLRFHSSPWMSSSLFFFLAFYPRRRPLLFAFFISSFPLSFSRFSLSLSPGE